jgi:Domain of unknown function (DUF4279)
VTDESQDDKRFHVELLIVHPTLDPRDIGEALGLETHFARRVGDPRKTPKGAPLSGTYPDTRWRYCVERIVKDQRFAFEVTRLVDSLEPHKEFFAHITSTGGRASIIVQFVDGYLSDEIPLATLAKLVELKLGLGLECYTGLRE